jgi:hypothetical protein
MAANGVTHAKVGAQFGISTDSVWRHMRKHVGEDGKARLRIVGASDPKIDLEALKRCESESLLQNLIAERVRLQRLADTAETGGNVGDAVKAARATVEVLALVGKLLGELRTGGTTITTNTVLLSSSWFELRRVITVALRPHPAAQKAVLDALREHERAGGVSVTGARSVELPPLTLEHQPPP